MSGQSIPEHVRKQAELIVGRFNVQNAGPPGLYFALRFKGKFVYLDESDPSDEPLPFCRLEWTGNMQDWEFAIYDPIEGRYDRSERRFPGSDLVDGTVEGALRAGLEMNWH